MLARPLCIPQANPDRQDGGEQGHRLPTEEAHHPGVQDDLQPTPGMP